VIRSHNGGIPEDADISEHPVLTWLHVSDLHFRDSGPVDRDVVLDSLVESVRRRAQKEPSPDLIFLSGDIAYSGKAEDYALATNWLDKLLSAAGLTRRELLVVPGNHDVDREHARGLSRTCKSMAEADAYLAPEVGRPHHMAKFGAYIDWYNQFFADIRVHPISTCGPVELIEVADRRVGILPINSALFCLDEHDHSKLWIGRLQLEQAAQALGELKPDLSVAVMHHPLEWLAHDEIATIRKTLGDSVDVVLRGHLHEADLERVFSRGVSTLTLATGAAYQTRDWPNKALYVTVRGAELHVAPIRFTDTPERTWVADDSVFVHPPGSSEIFQLGSFASEREPPPAARDPGALPAIRVRLDTPLIGREDDIRWLGALWADAVSGRRQIAVLKAPRGVGKSRLAAEWSKLRVGYGRTLYGDASTTGPYEPFAGALGPYIRDLPIDAMRWVVGPDGGQLSRLVPNLPVAVWSSSPVDREPAPGRHRLLEAVRAVLQRLCMACPTTLVIDNAHELDDDGLLLLQELLTLDNVPLLVLLLTRPYGDKPLEAVLPGMRRDYSLHERSLLPLSDTQAEELFHALGGQADSKQIRQANGVPVDLENLALRPPDGRSGDLDPEYAIVRELKSVERLLIDIAALAPDEITTATLADAASISLADAATALSHLETKGQLAHSLDGDEQQWHFTHAVRRQAVLDLLEADRAGDLAGQLAVAMQHDTRYEPGDIAVLYRMSGAFAEACLCFRAAGEAAEQSAAYDLAAQAFSEALAIAQREPGIVKDEPQLANSIGACLWNAGKFREARIAYKSAASIAERHDDPVQLADAALGRAGRFGFEGPSGGAEVAATCRAALEALGAGAPDLRARLLAALSHSVKFSEHGPTAEVLGYVNEAQRLVRSLDDTELLVEILCTTSWATWVPENLAMRATLASEAVRLADRVASEAPQKEVLQLESRLFSMTCNLESGDLPQARVDCEAISQLANDEKSPYYLALAAMGQAMLALLDGSENGEPMIFAALRIAQREHNPSLVRVFAAQMFYMRMLQGRLDELRSAAISLAEYDTSIVAWRSGLAVLFAETGRLAEAQSELNWAAADSFAAIPRDTFWLISMDNYARVAATLGEESAARILIRLLAPHEDQFVVAAGAGAVHGPVSLNLGVLHGMLGDIAEAIRLLQRAKVLAQAAGCQPALAEALVEEALLLAAPIEKLESVDDLLSRLTLATDAVESIGARRLAPRLAEAIELGYVEAVAADDPPAIATLETLAGRIAKFTDQEVGMQGRPIIRKAVAPATLRVIKALTGGMSDTKVENLLASRRAQRAVLAVMQRFYQPQIAHPFTGTVVLNLKLPDADAEPIVWTLLLRPDGVEIQPNEPDNPDLLVRMPAADFLGLLAGKINGVEEWFDGRFDVQGDPIVASRLVEIFGGPPPVPIRTRS
jgi:predicted MPP superfamily phosphohydrolase/tetratricopeptide (TPR) repeat protein